MSYEIIARKYRPRNFEQIIGQDKATLILKHSIDRSKVGHAYLFSGPRGVGKTTLARVFVKCLNCDRGMSSKPCDQCHTCQEIQQGFSLDYEEIDGASNRGIDHIREIKNSLDYSSPQGKYRIFVIDEVHMLTIEAFNALLKSLEEPPAKTVFILCTTEKHKIPATIQSRCQQLQFERLGIEPIEKHLKKILDLEKISYEPGSLSSIAKKADGSLRDAENLLEQAVAYSPEGLKSKQVLEILGELSSERKFNFIRHLVNNELKENQFLIHQLSVEGIHFEQFLLDLNELLSAIIYYKAGVKERKLLEVTEEDWKEIVSLESHFSQNELFLLGDLIHDFIKEMKHTTHERLSLYYFLIKIHRYKNLISTEDLKENITHLAKYYLEPDEKIIPKIDFELGSHPKDQPKMEKKPQEPSPQTIHPESPKHPNQVESSLLEFQSFVRSLEKEKVPLYRLILTFDFEEVTDQTLVLYNRENQDEKKLDRFKHDLIKELNQSKYFSQTQFSEIEIKENILQHNARVIQETLASKKKRRKKNEK